MDSPSFFELLVPPLPHYIACGKDTYSIGQSHISRRNIGVFDLLVVTKGQLFMGENNQEWTVGAGQALILRPDGHHYPIAGCREETHFYWLAFQTAGIWSEITPEMDIQRQKRWLSEEAEKLLANIQPASDLGIKFTDIFSIDLPRFISLSAPAVMYGFFQALIELELHSPSSARLQQQLIFQSIIKELDQELVPSSNASAKKVAELTASYLRQNYQKKFSYAEMEEALFFHPTYIARCMQKVFGQTPLEYLIQHRLEKAKLLLLNTTASIVQVAEEVGFPNAIYFTRCFTKAEGIPPQKFRKRYQV